MRRWLTAAGASLWLAATSSAAQTVPEPSSRALDLAGRYVELMDVGGMVREQYADQNSFTDEMMTGMEGLGLPVKDDAPATMPTFVPEADMEALAPIITLMESVMTQAVAETYPESELETLVAFYDTEQGRRILGRQGALQTRMTGLILERMPEMMEALGVDTDAMIQGMSANPYGESGAPTRSMSPQAPLSGGASPRDSVGSSPVPIVTEQGWMVEDAVAAAAAAADTTGE